MINPKNKRIEVTLSNEELELLNSICLRFNISKSRAISQALKVFAAKRKHIITLSYKETDKEKPQEETKEISDEEYKEALNEIESKKNKDDDFSPI